MFPRIAGILFLILFISGGCAPLPERWGDVPSPEEMPAEPAASEVSKNEAFVLETAPARTDTAVFTPITPARTVINRTMPEKYDRPIRVLLTAAPKVTLKSDAKIQFFDNKNQSFLSEKEAYVSVHGNQVIWKSGEESFSAGSWTLVPGDQAMIQLEKNTYRGNLHFSVKDGKLRIINSLSVEDYLKGVVPYEIGQLDSSRFEALKVQAVAARTYAYRQFDSKGSDFDVYDDTRDQVYNGTAGEAALPNAAVEATHGIVLIYDGEFAETYYHSTCGGRTEGLETWGKPSLPYLYSQADTTPEGKPWCGESSYSSWERKWDSQTLAAMFRNNLTEAKANPSISFKKIRHIQIRSKLSGRRIGELQIETDRGNFLVFGDRVRWLFKQGSKILPSSAFEIRHENGEWILNGKGFGHGIGMCQMGARARAKAGQSFSGILQFYYPGTTLEQWIP